ncbi:iron-containing alcohol dehydrogenase [Negadavirga shengliensis]|uniref:Iron-containing alcohol dehydrogenase n=1 Tax=Negadavirga shengliensis TaxID=1389218 RepID=A0ABV9T5X5_9BACT
MRAITLIQPNRLVFGTQAFERFREELLQAACKRVWILTIPPFVDMLAHLVQEAGRKGITVQVETYDSGEPTFRLYAEHLNKVQGFGAELIVGIGGGSVLDLAKLLAAMQKNTQSLEDVVGINQLKERKVKLYCLPTTSGTGSEVSPNAILLDESTLEKKGVISPFLVPDVTYVDPLLTLDLPPKITAETGVDALSHCIEAFTNNFSHPIVDDFALRGISLIGRNLLRAYRQGRDVEARSAVALGSMYGGMCLGPVNTAGVHALSYPLGGKYHVPHGLANAVLLPEVMAYNLPAEVEKHARIALALGVQEEGSREEIAQKGVEKVRDLVRACGIPADLWVLGVKEEDLNELAGLAMKVTRLLKNNPRELGFEDAVRIYQRLLKKRTGNHVTDHSRDHG